MLHTLNLGCSLLLSEMHTLNLGCSLLLSEMHTLNLGCSLLLSENCAIINDVDVLLHGFMLHIIYTTIFRAKRLNNFMGHVRLFNRLTRKAMV
jgi:hypothetical protein